MQYRSAPLTSASQSFKSQIFWPENFKYMKSPKAHCQTNTSMKLEIISWTNNRLLNLWFIHLSQFHIRGCSSQMFKKPIYIRFWQWSTQHCRSTPAIFILVTFIYHFIRKKIEINSYLCLLLYFGVKYLLIGVSVIFNHIHKRAENEIRAYNLWFCIFVLFTTSESIWTIGNCDNTSLFYEEVVHWCEQMRKFLAMLFENYPSIFTFIH